MGVNGDKLAGVVLFSASLCIFLYYTLWVIILPFVDTTHPVQGFFPPRKYAIAIPTVLLIMLATVVATFVSLTMMKSAARSQAKKAKPA